MKGFLQDTAQAVVAAHGWRDMRDITVVFPTRRAGLVWKNELKEMQTLGHRAAIFLPEITTLSELFDSLSPLYGEEELPMICRLYHIYKEVTGEQVPLDIFYGWGRQLLADFDNIDKSMPPSQVKAFFDNTIEAKELEDVQLDEEVRQRLQELLSGGHKTVGEEAIRHKYEALWRNMYTLYRRLNEALEAEHKGRSGARMRRVITDWADLREHYEGRQYVFIGFNYLMPVEKDLLRLLHAQGQASFYWDYVEDFGTNEKAYSFIRRHIADLGNAARAEAWGAARDVEVVCATAANTQVQYAGEWLRAHYKQKGKSTAVVICDEQMLEPVIYALPAITPEGSTTPEPINITKGFPLSHTQIFAEVVAYLMDRQHDKRADEAGYAAVLDRLLQAVLDPAEKAAMAARSKEVDGLREDSWQWLLIQESLYQTRAAIQQFKLLLEDELLREDVGSLALLRSLMRRYLEGISLPFHGEPITDIQVMGVLETRMLDFDNLLLMNVEEGVVPKQQADQSFIPYYLRKAYSMQTREESASVYAYNFFRLMRRAGKVTMVYSDADTAMGRKSMSRFLMQMMVSEEFRVTKRVLTENNQLIESDLLDLTGNETSLLSRLEKHADGALYYPTEAGKKPHRYTLSPSALATYLTCPRRFYLQYVVGIRDTEKETLIFAANTLGSMVHSAMEYIYTHCCEDSKQPVKHIDPAYLQRVLDNKEGQQQKALAEAYKEQNKEYKRLHPQQEGDRYILEEHRMENAVILGFVRNILRRDIADAEKEGLSIVLLEQRRTFEIDLGEIGRLQVGGTIDRLDICGGVMRVVDYKTGSYSEEKVSADSIDKMLSADSKSHYVLQTLMYSETLVENEHKQHAGLPLQPHLFFAQKNLGKLETTVTLAKLPVMDYSTVRANFRMKLDAKVREVLTTVDFPQTDENNCTAFCPFLQICGRSEK